MKHKSIFALLLAGFSLLTAQLWTNAGAAQSERVYTINDVDVDVSAASATRAREMALEEAQRKAFDRLMVRLVLASDRVRVPPVSGLQLASLVNGMEFLDERTSSRRYISTLRIHFNPGSVRHFLEVNRLPYSEIQSRPMVIAPLLEHRGVLYLWEADNDWRAAWQELSDQSDLVPLVVPEGDESDRRAMTSAQAFSNSEPARARLAARHSAVRTLIARARLAPSPADGRPVIEATLSGLQDFGDQSLDAEGSDREKISLVVTGESWEETPSLFLAVTERLYDQLRDRWKNDTLIHFGEEGELRLVAPVYGLEHWLRLRRKLDEVPAIRRIEVESLTVDKAVIEVLFFGSMETLRLAMAQEALLLKPAGDVNGNGIMLVEEATETVR